jgi:hypothetical protein
LSQNFWLSLRRWSSQNEALVTNFPNFIFMPFYENMDYYRHFGTRFILIHSQESTFWWVQKYFVWKKLKFLDFWKFETWFTEKRVRNLDKTQLDFLHGLFSCTFIQVSNVWLQNQGRRYILIESPKQGSKYCFLVILRPNSRIFRKTQLHFLLTFSSVNLSHKSLLYSKNSERIYIFKKYFRYFCKHVSDWTSHPSQSIFL